MVGSKCSTGCSRRRLEGAATLNPTTELCFIPSLDKEFVYLLGLEEVVQLRLELLDRIVNDVPKKRKAKGEKKNKKSPGSALDTCTPPKDPLICGQCTTDFSCSWERDINHAFLCQSCFKGSWRKQHRCTPRPEEPAVSEASGSFSPHTPASTTQPVWNDPEVKQEAAFPSVSRSASASANAPKRDQKVPRMSGPLVSPVNTSCSPTFYSDPTPSLPSSSSSDSFPLTPSVYYSSSSYASSLSNDSSSSLSLSPPHSSPQYSSRKAGAAYWVQTMAACSSLPSSTLGLNQVCNTSSVMASRTNTPVRNATKRPNEEEEEDASPTMHGEFRPGQDRSNPSHSNLSTTAAPGSSSASAYSTKFSKEHWAISRPTETSVKLTSASSSTSKSNQPVREDPQGKQEVAFLLVSPSVPAAATFSSAPGLASSHSAKSSQYSPKFSVHHKSLTQPAASTLNSPSNASSARKGKTSEEAAVLQKEKVRLKNATVKTALWIQGQEENSCVCCGSCPSMATAPSSSVPGCPEGTSQALESQESSLPDKIPQNPE